MELKNYRITDNSFWTGRVDDPFDPDSFRMHQVIRLLDLRELNLERAGSSALRICFIGFCCDEGIRRNHGRQGAEYGPRYIREEFADLPVTFARNTEIYDAGDIFCVNHNMEEAQEQLETAIKIMLDNRLFPVVLGGGHELVLGHYNGIINHLTERDGCSPDLGIINFDAHFDLRPYSMSGSSGTMFSQIADKCLIDKRDFSYMCLGVQTSGNTLSLFKKAEKMKVKYILAKDFTEKNFYKISEKIARFVQQHENIYITICSDVFNSAFAPGVSAMQPFGMNPEVVLTFLKKIIRSGKAVSLDIAEVSPRFDQDRHTAKLVAVIIYALINVLSGDAQK